MFDSGSQTQIAMIAGISQQQDRLEREKYMEYTLNELEKRIGYSFQDKKLLEHAMIHSSYANEHHLGKLGCNERLEFLGDAVLEVVSSDFLFRTFPEMPEGDMTKTRASLRADACILRTGDRSGWIFAAWKRRGCDRRTGARFGGVGCDGGTDRCDLSGRWFC